VWRAPARVPIGADAEGDLSLLVRIGDFAVQKGEGTREAARLPTFMMAFMVWRCFVDREFDWKVYYPQM
jgi:hypothetical protein